MMTDIVNEKISDALDVEYEETEIQQELITLDNAEYKREDDIKTDYDKRRKTLYDLIDKGNQALDTSLRMAQGSQHPRAFEVTGQLIKTMADVAKDLTDLQQSMDKLEGVEKEKKEGNVTNNAIFVGSTTELLKAIKGDK